MKTCRKLMALCLILCCLCGNAAAAGKKKKTPTPAPVPVTQDVIDEVPETIQSVLDLAYGEWETLAGKALKRSNKYTKWRSNYEFGWCGGFVTWLMLEHDIPQKAWTEIEEAEVPGIVHVKEAGVGKLVTGYLRMNRVTNMPQKGFLVVYGQTGKNGLMHIGLVWDVELLPNGKYRLTTIEGNMANTVKMYVHDYDLHAEKKAKNLTAVPKDEQTETESKTFSYKIQGKGWYINCFLMPWLPKEYGYDTDWTQASEEGSEPALTPSPAE
ncbi:MAG: CHAP domain-containing protein [Clostridia bacterium]|nr:CHAP domain-containing protein [Clostridia bacterium]MBQ6891495.1 CHAP domain-containing protein [Clostridia bacterium]